MTSSEKFSPVDFLLIKILSVSHLWNKSCWPENLSFTNGVPTIKRSNWKSKESGCAWILNCVLGPKLTIHSFTQDSNDYRVSSKVNLGHHQGRRIACSKVQRTTTKDDEPPISQLHLTSFHVSSVTSGGIEEDFFLAWPTRIGHGFTLHTYFVLSSILGKHCAPIWNWESSSDTVQWLLQFQNMCW